jgi:hypothetical protein
MTLDRYQRNRVCTLRPIMQMISDSGHITSALHSTSELVGFSKKRLEKLYYAWRDQGDEALLNKSKLKRPKKSAADSLAITAAERNKLRQLTIKCDSILLAIEALADWEGCSEDLRGLINRHRAATIRRRCARRLASAITTAISRAARSGSACAPTRSSA